MAALKKILLLTVILSCFGSQFSTAYNSNNILQRETFGKIVVANRASGSISVIRADTNKVERTVTLPYVNNTPEPMYVVYRNGLVFVGDRANNRVVAFDSRNYNVVASIPTGVGVFHMWADKYRGRLFVSNDMDNTVTVIDTYTLQAINTFSLPEDLINRGFKPHDIFVTDDGIAAYISLVDGQPGNDYIIKVFTHNFREIRRQKVGGDPHLFLSTHHRKHLFVPTQDDGMVNVLRRHDLTIIKKIPVTGAHGIFSIGRRLYVTTISEGGTNGLNTLDAKRLRLIDRDNTNNPTPHNITVTDDGRKIYITHSGAEQNTVSVFNTVQGRSLPTLADEITVENNPFGLAFVPH